MRAVLSAVISPEALAEILSKLSDAGEDTDRAMDGITVLPLEIVPFDVDLAVASARLRPVSMDAACRSWIARASLSVARSAAAS